MSFFGYRIRCQLKLFPNKLLRLGTLWPFEPCPELLWRTMKRSAESPKFCGCLGWTGDVLGRHGDLIINLSNLGTHPQLVLTLFYSSLTVHFLAPSKSRVLISPVFSYFHTISRSSSRSLCSSQLAHLLLNFRPNECANWTALSSVLR